MAPRAHRHVLTVLLVCSLATGCAVPGCDLHVSSPARESVDAVRIAWTLEPSPPVAGMPLVVRVTLRDAGQKPVTGARLRLEGVMSHPGMAPVTAALGERGNGEYETPLQFTMAGDWVLIVTGDAPGGTAIKKQIEITGVRPSS